MKTLLKAFFLKKPETDTEFAQRYFDYQRLGTWRKRFTPKPTRRKANWLDFIQGFDYKNLL